MPELPELDEHVDEAEEIGGRLPLVVCVVGVMLCVVLDGGVRPNGGNMALLDSSDGGFPPPNAPKYALNIARGSRFLDSSPKCSFPGRGGANGFRPPNGGKSGNGGGTPDEAPLDVKRALAD